MEFFTARSIDRLSPSRAEKSRRGVRHPPGVGIFLGVKGGAAGCGPSLRVRCRARRVCMHCELNFDEPSISYSIGQQRSEPVKGRSQRLNPQSSSRQQQLPFV